MTRTDLLGETELLEEFVCDSCGACCRTFPIFASLTDAQHEPRISSEGKELAPWLRTAKWTYQLHPLPFHESCCFLDANNLCKIYSSRPTTCREFAAGGSQCQEARTRVGLPKLEPIQPTGNRE